MIRTVRRACAATSSSWVMVSERQPWALSSSNRASTDSVLAESRLPVGSSQSRMLGSPTSARAIATRCFSPPESLLGLKPTRWEADLVQRLEGALLAALARIAAVDLGEHHVVEHRCGA